ncbi:MAG: phosphoglucosamine mutase [Phycisphaerae bacterium]|nr:phosphoglucosamine mutase [Phycisphaerae bacterium]
MQLITSVSGIRGVVGETLTPHLAADAAAAFATFIGRGLIVVGRDSRQSGDMVKSAVVSGLLACGCDVVDVGVCATPTTAMMVTRHKAAGGVMITASHNPKPWNGIKFFGAEGCAPPKPLAEKILGVLAARDFRFVPTEKVGRLACDETAVTQHVEAVLKTVDAAAIRKRRFRVVLDSINGGGAVGGRQLLEALGCDVVHVNGEPNGDFAHTPEPTADNLVDLTRQTREAGAAAGFAQDPDADRLAIVDETGRYIGEEYTLVLAARQVLNRRRGNVAVNLSTSRMIDDLVARYDGCAVYRSAVGEANVVEVMKRENCIFGGEGNGGVIDPRIVYVRDSLISMALVLQLLADEARPLSQVVADLPSYASVKQKFECSPDRTAKILAAVRKAFADEKTSDVDGLRIDWPDGWVHIRGSNTEPIMRVIAEARDEDRARALCVRVRAVADAVG